MEEITKYSLQTAADALGVHRATVRDRAKKMGIDMSRGLTAKQVDEIGKFKGKKRGRSGGTLAQLMEELAAIRGQ